MQKTTSETHSNDRRSQSGDLPPTAGHYSRTFVAPRPVPPNPNHFAHPDDWSERNAEYLIARDAWKKDYPNLHTAEEEKAHVESMRAIGGAS